MTALAGIFSVHIPGVLGNRCYLWMAVLFGIDAPDDGANGPFNAGLFAHFLPPLQISILHSTNDTFSFITFTNPPVRVLGRGQTSFNELHNPQRVFSHDTAAATSLAFAFFFHPLHDGFSMRTSESKIIPFAS